jgi:hypothetical protein
LAAVTLTSATAGLSPPLPPDPAKLPQPSVTTTMAVIGVGLPQATGLKKLAAMK